jgi:ribosomal protein L37E
MKKVKVPKGTFWAEKANKLYMVRCPECKNENWAMAVATGICAWCGYDCNSKNNKKVKK